MVSIHSTSNFISISVEFNEQKAKFKQNGFFKSRSFIHFDEKNNNWGVKQLNWLEIQLRRLFGAYASTHKATIAKGLSQNKFNLYQVLTVLYDTPSNESTDIDFAKILQSIRLIWQKFEVDQFEQKKTPQAMPFDFDLLMPQADSPKVIDLSKNVKISNSETVQGCFQSINSSKQVKLIDPVNWTLIRHRDDFLKLETKAFPPLILAYSPILPEGLVTHLLNKPQGTACGIKYISGDPITNGEAALHSLLTPLAEVIMLGDHIWRGAEDRNKRSFGEQNFGNNLGRQVILSASIQPDFEAQTETNFVMAYLIGLGEDELKGEPLPNDFKILSQEDKAKDELRAHYDLSLKKHAIYHLTANHCLPSSKSVKKGDILALNDVETFFDSILTGNPSRKKILHHLQSKVISVTTEDKKHHFLSLEMLFNLYLEQLQQELGALDQAAPQGFIYTIDPPSIFASLFAPHQKQAVQMFNRLQALAIRSLIEKMPFEHLKMIAFNDFSDSTIVPYFKEALKFSEIKIGAKKELYEYQIKTNKKNQSYEIQTYRPQRIDPSFANCALVLHNNSDAYRPNIKYEGVESLDGLIGNFSNAAVTLCDIPK